MVLTLFCICISESECLLVVPGMRCGWCLPPCRPGAGAGAGAGRGWAGGWWRRRAAPPPRCCWRGSTAPRSAPPPGACTRSCSWWQGDNCTFIINLKLQPRELEVLFLLKVPESGMSGVAGVAPLSTRSCSSHYIVWGSVVWSVVCDGLNSNQLPLS